MTALARQPVTIDATPLPWWRHPFVWLVVGLPASGGVGGIIAIRGADPVVPEYSSAAKQAAEESLSREEATRVPAELARNHAATPRH
jgi:uncharacterized protein